MRRPPRHTAVALDVEYRHYRLQSTRTVLRVPAEVAVVGEAAASPPLLHTRVAPPPTLPPDAAWVGGVRLNDGDGGRDERPLAAVAADIETILSAGATLVGHGVASDLASLGLATPARCVDTAAVLARGGDGPTPSLAALTRRVLGRDLRPDSRARHSALDDARAVIAVYLALGRPGIDREAGVEEEAARIVDEWERRRREVD